MAVRTYDPKQVTLIVGAFPIGGFADGSYITVTRENDAYQKVVGADGETSRAKSNDRSGTITITLAQTSPSNDVLSAISLADELNNDGIVPIAIRDGSGRTIIIAPFSWVQKPADVEFAKEITDREWVMACSDISMTEGGNPDAQ